ncbi:MAG: hypothetical protein ACYC7D_06240 [Nitrososphaerales archaeon]
MRAKRRAASRSTLLAEIAVVIFIGLVLIGLYNAYLPTGTNTVTNEISIQNLTLLSGSPSSHSLSSSCQGDATLELELVNPTLSAVHLSNIVIYSSGLSKNATTLVSVSNSCLSLSESNPAIQAESSYLFDGYMDTALPFGSTFKYLIQLDNGENFTGTLVAQS